MEARWKMIMGSALLVLTGCQHMGMGGDNLPTVTRTGEVKDIVIREDLSLTTVVANPGDEIRWINKRQGDVRVIFLSPVTEMLSCQRNFGGLLSTDRNQYTANLGTNDTASVCFKNPTEIKYVVRAESKEPSGELNIPGTLAIGTTDRASGQEPIFQRGDRRAAQADQDQMLNR